MAMGASFGPSSGGTIAPSQSAESSISSADFITAADGASSTHAFAESQPDVPSAKVSVSVPIAIPDHLAGNSRDPRRCISREWLNSGISGKKPAIRSMHA